MTVDVTLRPARLGDVDTLVGLMAEYYAYEELPFDAPFAHAAMFRLLNEDLLGRVWLIRAYATVVGYIVITFGYSLEYGGRYAKVDEFFLYEVYRGRGIGTQSLEMVEAYCHEHDFHAIELEIERGNWSAKHFYDRLGFKDNGRYLLVKRLEGGNR
jgi:GNAT superfamily N-acetyltransferase